MCSEVVSADGVGVYLRIQREGYSGVGGDGVPGAGGGPCWGDDYPALEEAAGDGFDAAESVEDPLTVFGERLSFLGGEDGVGVYTSFEGGERLVFDGGFALVGVPGLGG